MKIKLRKDLGNLLSLTTVQGVNAVVPIILFPFILLQVGSEKFAELVAMEALSIIALTVSLYSFDVTAVRRVVNCTLPEDADRVSKILSEVLSTRLFLLITSSAILLLFTFWWQGPDLTLILALWLIVPAGVCVQSLWLFQGLEATLPLAVGSILGKLLPVLLLFFVLDGPDDALLVPVMLGVGSLLAGLIPIVYLLSKKGVHFRLASPKTILTLLKDGQLIFFGNFSVMLYRDINVLIATVLGLPAMGVAAYSLGEKFVKGAQAVVRPLNQIFFPKALRALVPFSSPGYTAFFSLLRQVAIQLIIVGVLATCIVLAPLGIDWANFLGGEFVSLEPALFLASLMAPALLFGVFNFMYGVVGLNHLNEQRTLFLILVGTGLMNLFYCAILGFVAGIEGVAFAFVLSEFMLAILIAFRYFRKVAVV